MGESIQNYFFSDCCRRIGGKHFAGPTYGLCIDFINRAYGDTVIGLDSLFEILTNLNGLIYVVAGLWGAYIAFCFMSKYSRKWADPVGPVLVYVWAGFLLISALLAVFLMFHANMGGNAEKYGSLGKYLVFNDSLPMHKLFGHGADTFGILTVCKIGAEMPERFENAHNEYLQYFITIGPAACNQRKIDSPEKAVS